MLTGQKATIRPELRLTPTIALNERVGLISPVG